MCHELFRSYPRHYWLLLLLLLFDYSLLLESRFSRLLYLLLEISTLTYSVSMRSQWFLASCLFWLLLKCVWRGNLFPSLGLRYNCLERLRGLTRLLSLSIEKLRSALTGSITTEGRSWCINLISFSIWGECRCILEFIVLVGKITLLLLDIGWSTYNIRLLLLVIALIDIKMEISIFKIGPHILSFLPFLASS